MLIRIGELLVFCDTSNSQMLTNIFMYKIGQQVFPNPPLVLQLLMMASNTKFAIDFSFFWVGY